MNHTEALLEAARQGDLTKLSELVDQDPTLLNHRNEMGQSAVLLAKYHRQQQAVELLLERGAELTIHEAAAVGVRDRVEKLVALDPGTLDSFSKDGFTPLSLACFFGNAPIVEDLIASGASVNTASKNPMRVQPLHAATAGRHSEIVHRLVDAGADVNARQQNGFTPLHGAANNGDQELVHYFLGHGADRDARTDGGQTALDLALTGGHHDTAAELLSGGATTASS